MSKIISLLKYIYMYFTNKNSYIHFYMSSFLADFNTCYAIAFNVILSSLKTKTTKKKTTTFKSDCKFSPVSSTCYLCLYAHTFFENKQKTDRNITRASGFRDIYINKLQNTSRRTVSQVAGQQTNKKKVRND